MSIEIRAAVAIKPGAKLRYDCPFLGGDYRSDEFFRNHRGKHATFVGYAEKLIGPLNFGGLMPGRYVDPKVIRVQFDGEKLFELNTEHFTINREDCGQLVTASDEEQRVGDLSHPILFYPDDIVRFKEKPIDCLSDEVRKVRQIFLGRPFVDDSTLRPRYEVMETEAETKKRIRRFDEANAERSEKKRWRCNPFGDPLYWNTGGKDIELVSRGNVWALYNDPSKLSFESDKAEAAFWAQNGICKYVEDEIKTCILDIHKHVLDTTFGLSFEDAYRLFASGYADVIRPTFGNFGDVPRYEAKVMHACFAQHRERVRALTERMQDQHAKQSVE